MVCEFFPSEAMSFFTGFVNCCNCLGAAAGYLIAPRQPRKKKTYFSNYIYHYIHVFLVLLPFANVTLNAFACEKKSQSFCQVCGQVFVVIFQADSRTRNIFVAAGHPV